MTTTPRRGPRWCAWTMPLVLLACGEDPGEVDADAGAAPDAASAADSGPLTRFGPTGMECADVDDFTFASEGNEGHFAAVRLTPPSAPFSLRAVEYELHHFSLFADRCLALPHQLLVFRVASDAPTPARPRYDLDIRVTPEAPTPLPDENTTVTHRETFAPIRIGEGEDVVVAISMEGRTFDDGTAELVCLSAVSCSDWEADEHLWSNAAAPPFDWATLASFENRTSYQIALFGLPE